MTKLLPRGLRSFSLHLPLIIHSDFKDVAVQKLEHMFYISVDLRL